MSKKTSPSVKPAIAPAIAGYARLLGDIDHLIATARSLSARAVNAVMTATYWDAGRQIVEFEQGGKSRAAYGAALLERLSSDLTAKHGRGFSVDNLERFRLLYLRFPMTGKSATPLRKSEPAVLAWIETIAARLPLSWSHYTRLLRVKSDEAFAFYHAEALRGGWNIKQLERQIGSLFYERAMLSKNKAAILIQDTPPTGGPTMKRLISAIRPLAKQLAALQRRMKAAGLFANDRELLDCPQCGLREDVLISGLLIAYRERGFHQDTGLRFEELTAGTFRCPSCGQTVCEPFAEDQQRGGFLAKPAAKRRKPAAPVKGRKRKA